MPVAIALLTSRGRVFMVRRARGRPLAGQWEFPGGKVELGESPEDAIRRELREELGLAVGRLALFGAYSHVYHLPEGPTHYVLIAYRSTARSGPWDRAGAWLDARSAKGRTIVAGSRPILVDLEDDAKARRSRGPTPRRQP